MKTPEEVKSNLGQRLTEGSIGGNERGQPGDVQI